MSNIILTGDTSGTLNLAAPAIAGTNTQTLVAATGTLAPLISGTVQASTSGTSIDFTSIPSWVKRVTVMFNGVSTNGSTNYLVQIGSGSITSSGYTSTGASLNGANATSSASSTAGFLILSAGIANILSGSMVLTVITGNTWISSHTGKISTTNGVLGGGDVALSGALDRIRVTTTNGTDVFDAGSINILYE